MTHHEYSFEPPERFVVGTVGPPGDRLFFLQARGGGRVITVAVHKIQVILLAEKLDDLLAEVARRFSMDISAPAVPPDNDPLDTPIDEDFRVGTLGLAFDVDTASIVIEAVSGDGDESDEETISQRDCLRVRLTIQETRLFVDRVRRIIASGGLVCSLCGQPMDPHNHICPRRNGYRAHPG